MQKIVLPVLALASSLAAQTTHFVGPGGFPQIQDAVAAAVDGDTIEVAPGNYFSFDCTLAVTIVAQTPGTVLVDYSLAQLPASCGCSCLAAQAFVAPSVLSPLSGESMHVVGIDFGGFQTITPCFSGIQHFVSVTAGRVTFDSCSIARMRVETNGVAVLQDCDVAGSDGERGITIDGGDVTIVGGNYVGAGLVGPVFIGFVRPAISMVSGRLHASHASFSAGAPGLTGLTAPGIQQSGGTIWLTDATVTGEGTCAVQSAGVLRMDRVTLIDGGGGVVCPTAPVGAPLLGVARNGPITVGALFEATMTSQPGDLQFFYGSLALDEPLMLGPVDQPIWIDAGSLFFSLSSVGDALGQSKFSFQVPNLPVLSGYEYWVQAVGGSTFPLQASPPVGGIVR